MRNIYKPAMSNSSRGLFKFAKVQKTCLGCKNLLKPSQEIVCDNCSGRVKDIYIERKQELSNCEKKYCDLWVQCQRCQLIQVRDS